MELRIPSHSHCQWFVGDMSVIAGWLPVQLWAHQRCRSDVEPFQTASAQWKAWTPSFLQSLLAKSLTTGMKSLLASLYKARKAVSPSFFRHCAFDKIWLEVVPSSFICLSSQVILSWNVGKQRCCNAFHAHEYDLFAHFCQEAPELASSRAELLEKYGKVKFQLESGIDEASAFFKLTKAAVMQHDETCCKQLQAILAECLRDNDEVRGKDGCVRAVWGMAKLPGLSPASHRPVSQPICFRKTSDNFCTSRTT